MHTSDALRRDEKPMGQQGKPNGENNTACKPIVLITLQNPLYQHPKGELAVGVPPVGISECEAAEVDEGDIVRTDKALPDTVASGVPWPVLGTSRGNASGLALDLIIGGVATVGPDADATTSKGVARLGVGFYSSGCREFIPVVGGYKGTSKFTHTGIIDQGNQNVMTDSMSYNDFVSPPVLVAPPAQLDLPFDDSDNRPVGEEVEVFPEMKIRGTHLNSDAHTPTGHESRSADAMLVGVLRLVVAASRRRSKTKASDVVVVGRTEGNAGGVGAVRMLRCCLRKGEAEEEGLLAGSVALLLRWPPREKRREGKDAVAATNHDHAPSPPPFTIVVEVGKEETRMRHGLTESPPPPPATARPNAAIWSRRLPPPNVHYLRRTGREDHHRRLLLPPPSPTRRPKQGRKGAIPQCCL
nr:hypothetical protein Iba_chr10bCG4460 [Ipomoea batatas]